MSGKDLSKDVLGAVKNKTGKTVSPKSIQKLAETVQPSTMKSEEQLRQLIKQVAGLVNLNVSEETTREIIQAVKGSKINPNSMESLLKMMKK